MAQQTPKISDINANLIAQIEAEIGTTIPLLPKSFTRVLAKALAAIFIIGYKFAGWIYLQMFVSTASFSEVTVSGKTFTPLIEWGKFIGVGDAKPANAAEVSLTVTVLQQIDSIPAGALLRWASTGLIYSVTSAVALDAPTVTINAIAISDSKGGDGKGSIGNATNGTIFEFVNSLPYVDRKAVVSGIVSTASDAETEESYRSKVASRFQRRPQGGARIDYQIWGEETPDIDLVLPYTGDPNERILYSRSASQPDGIPLPDTLLEVKNNCLFDEEGFATRAPPGTVITSLPIFRSLVDVEIIGLGLAAGSPTSESELMDQIEAALTSHLLSLQPYILGVSVLPARDRISAAAIGGVIYAVTESNSGFFSSHVVKIGASVIDSKILDPGELAKLGTLSFI